MILHPHIAGGAGLSRPKGLPRKRLARGAAAWACALLWAAAAGGCDPAFMGPKNPSSPATTRPVAATGPNTLPPLAATQPVPSPINLLLPRSIHIHPLTGGPRILDGQTQARGIEVQLSVKDADAHAGKAFGDFRFELYEFRPNSLDPKGARLALWDVSTMGRQANLQHWDEIRRMYEFRLGWDQNVAVGKRLVLVAVFSSPFTDGRLFDEHTFVAGE